MASSMEPILIFPSLIRIIDLASSPCKRLVPVKTASYRSVPPIELKVILFKALLIKGKIKSTPESIYACLQRAPMHLARSRASELSAVDGIFWSMVDSAHAALIAAKVQPASPEHIPGDLKENFVNSGKLKMKYVIWYRNVLVLHKKIAHGEVKDLKGIEIDALQEQADEFLGVMANLVKELIE